MSKKAQKKGYYWIYVCKVNEAKKSYDTKRQQDENENHDHRGFIHKQGFV